LAAPPSYQRIEAIRTPAGGGHIGEASGHRNILEEVNFHVAVSEIGVSGKRCRYAPGGGLSSALRQALISPGWAYKITSISRA